MGKTYSLVVNKNNTTEKKKINKSLKEVKDFSDIVLSSSFKILSVNKDVAFMDKKENKVIKTEEKVVAHEKTIADAIKLINDDSDRNAIILAEVSDRFEPELDDEAQRIISVARMGSLFDYESIKN